jgi:hydroxymethylpyrimidine/phosphomethylpyrimidine kinase
MTAAAPPRILIVAGSDSGGGAGIQADIKTVTMLGGFATTAITAITAQNSLGVDAVMAVPAEMVVKQIDAVLADIGADAIKIGMIGDAATAQAVAARLAAVDVPIVFDPVMVATSGAALADPATIAAFDALVALAALVTPNLPELAAFGGEAALAGRARAVLIKGGHSAGDVLTDRLIVHGRETARWDGGRIDSRHTHGTGCTLASAIAVGLGRGLALEAAIAGARQFVRIAIRAAPGFGAGHGPMGHQAVRLDLGPSPRLNQVTLPMADASRAFYRALGLRQIVGTDDGHYARFEAPGGATLSIEAGARPTVFLECEDLDAEVARLTAVGVAIDQMPADQSWLWREARLTDPAGNAICLYEAGENRRFPPWRID